MRGRRMQAASASVSRLASPAASTSSPDRFCERPVIVAACAPVNVILNAVAAPAQLLLTSVGRTSRALALSAPASRTATPVALTLPAVNWFMR